MKKEAAILALVIFWTSTSNAIAFSDVPEKDPHYHAINYLTDEGVLAGYGDDTIRPGAPVNRAELVKILTQALGKKPATADKNCFPDVKEEWFAPSVCFAKKQKWAEGYKDGTFRPEQNVNKMEALKIILSAFGEKTMTPTGKHFSDTTGEEWFEPYLETAVQKNLIDETSGKLRAGNARTRGEIAETVARLMQLRFTHDAVYSDSIRAEFAALHYINEERAQNGVKTRLKMNLSLMRSARAHSMDMAENIGHLQHPSSDGVTQHYTRINAQLKKDEGKDFLGGSSENIGRSTAGPTAFDAVKWVHDIIFMPEPDGVCNHRTTILSTCGPFTEVGIGVYIKKGSPVYFTEDFIAR